MIVSPTTRGPLSFCGRVANGWRESRASAAVAFGRGGVRFSWRGRLLSSLREGFGDFGVAGGCVRRHDRGWPGRRVRLCGSATGAPARGLMREPGRTTSGTASFLSASTGVRPAATSKRKTFAARRRDSATGCPAGRRSSPVIGRSRSVRISFAATAPSPSSITSPAAAGSGPRPTGIPPVRGPPPRSPCSAACPSP